VKFRLPFRRSYVVLIIFGVYWGLSFLYEPYDAFPHDQQIILILGQWGFFGIICGIFLLSVRFYNKRKAKRKEERIG